MRIVFYGFLFCFLFVTYAQQPSISIKGSEVPLNEYFTLSIKVEDERLKSHSNFPDIEGFIKRGTSSSSSTNYINGQVTTSSSITQNYQAQKKGSYVLEAFSMVINGITVKYPKTNIIVNEAKTRRGGFYDDPFNNFFQQPSGKFIDVKADAFLSLSFDKREVYVGEGFTATLALYVSQSNRAEMRFFDLSKQIAEITKKIKPANCWEENFQIGQIIGESVQLNSKKYTMYKIYQSAFYPLNVENIDFEPISLEMLKYNVAKNPSFFGRNREENRVFFKTKRRQVKIKDLPPHPMKDVVNVGKYRLEEKISTDSLSTGKSFSYEFKIRGQGNIAAINQPQVKKSHEFDFYDPNIRQNITKSSNWLRGSKSYEYYAIPNEPGQYNLSDYVQWVFFNTQKDDYDTLQSNITLEISGESRKNFNIAASEDSDFYDRIKSTDNGLSMWASHTWHDYLFSILGFFVVGLTVLFLVKNIVLNR